MSAATVNELEKQLDRLRAEDAVVKQCARLAFTIYTDAVKTGDDALLRLARDRFLGATIALRRSAAAIARAAKETS